MSSDRLVKFDDLVACPGCDWLHYRAEIRAGRRAYCARCGEEMYTHKRYAVDRALAACIAGIILLLVSLTLPFLSLSRAGVESSISLIDAVEALWLNEMRILGVLTFAFIVLLPLARLSLLLWVLLGIRLKLQPNRWMRSAYRIASFLEPWAMADVFMIGVVVSLVKISSLATLDIGPAFYALLGLIVATVLITLVICKDTIWDYLCPRLA